MASVLLQHSVNDTTHVSYLNQLEELAEAIAKMRVPLAFKHGPTQAERQLAKQQAANAAMMKAAQFSPPAFPDPAEWQFHDVGFIFRGHHCRMEGALRMLKALALSPLHRAASRNSPRPFGRMATAPESPQAPGAGLRLHQHDPRAATPCAVVARRF